MTANKGRGTATRAKKPSATRKTSLYRLRCSGPVAEEDLTSFVLAKYLEREGFATYPVDHEGIRGLLMTGTVAPGPASWCDPLSALTGQGVDERNGTAFGLLIVRTEVSVYGLAYGMGHLMINPARIDPGFGIEFAVRCMDEDRITKVRRQLMDARGRSDENSVTSGEHIRGFGIEQFGEIVSQISGKAKDVPLTFTKDRKRPAHVTGDDRKITLQLASTAGELMQDLRSIEEVCARPEPLPGLGFIAQVRPLDPKTDQAKRLDDLFDAVLGGEQSGRIALAVPGECREHYELAESFVVSFAGASSAYEELDADQLVAAVKGEPKGFRLQALRAGRVEMFEDADGNQQLSRKIPADQWLTSEISDGAVHYFYWQGKWYEIGAEYLTTVETRIAELLSRPASVTLPPWTESAASEEHDEDWFNKQIAKQDGYVLLDKNTVRTSFFRGGGLEVADALGPASQLVCVKKADRSTAPLNHLFAQGRVAVETLRFDRDLREKFLAKLRDIAPDHPVDQLSSTPVLVFGILLKEGVPITVGTLFAFAKISLLHTATMLEGMGARLEIVSISRTQVSGMGQGTSGAGGDF
jgi:uncharacterized protein (TIGR04141 family)